MRGHERENIGEACMVAEKNICMKLPMRMGESQHAGGRMHGKRERTIITCT